MCHLTVYRASAGSGKTFTLTTEYIKLLLEDPYSYRSILAVTFTNKATAEMKERILSQLYGIAIGDSSSSAYLDCLLSSTSLSEATIRSRCGEALHYILHDYSRFNVQTIDTFSVSIMRNLARELGVGCNISIDIDSEGALSSAVYMLVASLSDGDAVLSWLTALVTSRVDEGSNWRMLDSIKEFASQIFNELFVEEGALVRCQLADSGVVERFQRALVSLRDESEAALQQLASSVLTGGVSVSGLGKVQQRTVNTYFTKLSQGDYEPNIRPMLKALLDSGVLPELNAAERWRGTYHSCEVSLQHITDMRLLAVIDTYLNDITKASHRFLLANINRHLRSVISDSDTPFVLEKAGTTISYVMMDEFQDTSRLQWQTFRPLVLEGLAHNASSLIVGDVKQSIYRWRGGDWEILNSELRGTLGPYRLVDATLTTNRRSAGRVITFNNMLFSRACDVLSERYERECGTPCVDLMTAYADVRQEFLGASDEGYVRVSFLPDSDQDPSYAQRTYASIGAQVQQLLSSGVRQKDIAILVRKTRQIKDIAEYFSRELSLTLVSDEAFRLDASPAITVIVDAMRCVSLPSLTADSSKLLVLTLALHYGQYVTGGDVSTLFLCPVEEIVAHYLPAAFVAQHTSLSLLPLYELVSCLYTLFDLWRIAGQDGYLCALYDAVVDFVKSHHSNLPSFIAYYDEHLYKKSLPVGEVDGIRILTIHKAKGLEYHTVLVPLCDWSLEVENPLKPPRMWCHPTEAPYNLLDLLPIDYNNKKLPNSVYASDYRAEQLRLWVDNLNLLYVAFTRAKKNLIVWTKQPSAELMKNMNKMPALLRASLPMPPESSVYECGELVGGVAERVSIVTNRLLQRPQHITLSLRGQQVMPVSPFANRSALFVRDTLDEVPYIARGKLLHYLFANISSRDSVPVAAHRLRYEGLTMSHEQEEELITFAYRAIDKLGRDWYDGSWELYNECAIVYADAIGVHQRRPDRVMMRGGEVVVVDYKFGGRHTSYRDQVREYMQLLNAMGYGNVRGYIWYVFNEELEEVE